MSKVIELSDEQYRTIEQAAAERRLPRLWTRSKFISSVGPVTLDVVQADIAGQKGL